MSVAVKIGEFKFEYKPKTVSIIKKVGDTVWAVTPVKTQNELDTILETRYIPTLNGIDMSHSRIVDLVREYDMLGDHSRMVDKYVPEKILTIPYKYNFNDRSFENYKAPSGKILPKFSEVSPETYYKYHISLIGNPSDFIIFTMDIDKYKEIDEIKRNLQYGSTD